MAAGVQLEILDNPARVKATLSKRALRRMCLQEELERGQETKLVLHENSKGVLSVREPRNITERVLASVLRLRTDGTGEVVFHKKLRHEPKEARLVPTREIPFPYGEVTSWVAKPFRSVEEMKAYLTEVYQEEITGPEGTDLDQEERRQLLKENPAVVLVGDLATFRNFLVRIGKATERAGRRQAAKRPDGRIDFCFALEEGRAVWYAMKALSKLVRQPPGPAVILTVVPMAFGKVERRSEELARHMLKVLQGDLGTEILGMFESFFTSEEGDSAPR